MTKEEKLRAIEKMQKLVKEVSRTMYELADFLTTATEDPDFDSELADAMCAEYPFSRSFDEEALEVSEWNGWTQYHLSKLAERISRK